MRAIEFMRPHLLGARFEGKSIPLEVLRDLSVLQEMIIEVAKWQFLSEHSDRKRSPRGFAEGVEIRLTNVEDGSAIPILTLFLASQALPTFEPNLPYFEKARELIVSAVYAAEHEQAITEHLPEKFLSYFDTMGRSLRDGEAVEFSTKAHPTPAHLNKETRRRLVLASPRAQKLTEETVVRGLIPEADQEAMSFQIQLPDGHKIKAPLNEQHREIIIDAFNGYRDSARVMIQSMGLFDRQNRLVEIQSIEHVTPLDPLDPVSRLEELRCLKSGWLDGRGEALSSEGIDWLITNLECHFFYEEIKLPHLYPTLNGGIQAEWNLAQKDMSLEIDLITHRASWHSLHLLSVEEEYRDLNLDEEDAWVWLSEQIARLSGGES